MTDNARERLAAYVTGYRERIAQERRARLLRHEQAMAQAEAMVTALTAKFPDIKVWIFGSILDASRFDLTADIDLACEGLPDNEYWTAYALLESCGDIPFDLVLLETCAPRLRDRIRSEGRLLT